MARITIKRPNGSMEYAELTTDRSLAGNDRLVVMKNGTTHYAKLDTGVSTHMYVVKNGRKLYVQKEVNKPKPYTWVRRLSLGGSVMIERSGVYSLDGQEFTLAYGDTLSLELGRVEYGMADAHVLKNNSSIYSNRVSLDGLAGFYVTITYLHD